jgi:DNA polymerase-3 subunit alpha
MSEDNATPPQKGGRRTEENKGPAEKPAGTVISLHSQLRDEVIRPVPFVHLRVHTAFSLLEGAIKVGDLAELARSRHVPALGVTDTANLFGALEISESLSAAGIQPILGLTLFLECPQPDQFAPSLTTRKGAPPALALLAKDATGWANLMKLSSAAFRRSVGGPFPAVPLSLLKDHGAGLIALTGGTSGPINRLLAGGQMQAAQSLLDELSLIFPRRLYVEIQRHGLAEEEATEAQLLHLAYERHFPIVASNDVYFADEDAFEAHNALLCIAEGAYVAQSGRRILTPEHRFKSASEMCALFADLPEALEATVEIARRCSFRPVTHAPILPRFGAQADFDEAGELRRQAEEGLSRRLAQNAYAPAESYRQRLYDELEIINRMAFPGYFLIVADFIQWAKARHIPVGPGRGSGAGSVVAWALTITDLDPLRFGLLFERFLNPERVSMPDFDIDFCQDRRDEVIRYVQERYSDARVAQIITFGKLQARAVLRDVGRVLQMPYGQVDRLCKLVPNIPAAPLTLNQAIEGEPRLQEARDSDETVARMLDIAQKLEGLYRHASTHAAGVVIGDRPLEELIPLYHDPRSDMTVTQYDMKWVEPAGLVKFDFLGLKTLTVIHHCCTLLAQRGIHIDPGNLPLDDEATYRMLAHGETIGVFQLESGGMRDALRRLRPDSIEDIIALVALYRPGPMANIPKYIACKHGEEKPDYLHPSLEPILRETYGVIIYQEQVMQIAQLLSGYTLGEADLLRRAMGKKKPAEMAKQKERFISGAVDSGVPRARADSIFELVALFAGYGFNKSHAAAYALVAYQTAYLKANYPVEFLAASMSLDIANTDKLAFFRQEALRLDIKVKPPSVNHSGAGFIVKDGAIRYALGAIRNVGHGAMEALVAERESNRPFRDIFEMMARVDPRLLNKRALESLARAGALDELHGNRRQLVEAADQLLAHAQMAAQARASQQRSLFDTGGSAIIHAPRLREVEDWLPVERLAQEFEAVGFFLSGHPLDDYIPALRRQSVLLFAELSRLLRDGESWAGRLAGTVISKREHRGRSGRRFAFAGFSDPSGQYEGVIFSDLLSSAGDLLEPGKAVVLSVEATREGEDIRLRVQSLRSVDEMAARSAQGLKIFINTAAALDTVKSRLDRPGKGPVHLVLVAGDQTEVEMRLAGHFRVTPEIRGALKIIPGVLEIQEI